MLPETITQWVRALVVYMLLISVLLHLLPDGAYRKYIRIFIGLLLLLLAAQPVCTWLSDGSFSFSEDLLAKIVSEEQESAFSDEEALLEEAQEKQEALLLRAQALLSEKMDVVPHETETADR